MKKIFAVLLALVLSCAGLVTAFAAEDKPMFLDIDGINGNSDDSKHACWIDVIDYTVRTDADGVVNGFTFTHEIDPSTADILSAYMKRRWIEIGTFEVCECFCGRQYTVKTVQMEYIKITNVNVFEMEDGRIAETVTLTVGNGSVTETPIEF